MKKTLKIIICCIMAISIMALMCFSTFAAYGSNVGSYGYISYLPLTNTDEALPCLSMPIVVDSSFPTFGNYVNGSNRRFQTYNTKGSFAILRFILPNAQGEYYVSSATKVDMVLSFEYSSSYLSSFFNSSDSDLLFTFPKIVDNFGNDYGLYCGDLNIDVYIVSDHIIDMSSYSFGLSSQMSIYRDELLILEELPDDSTVIFNIEWSLTNDFFCRAADLSISLPLEYRPTSFDISYVEGFDIGKEEGMQEGYDDGYSDGQEEWEAKYDNLKKSYKEGLDNSNAVMNFFQGILETVQGTLNIFFELEVFGFQLGNIVAILLSALVVIVVIKLIL